ncbi:MAG: glycosyltransferase family 2 protein [Salinigranum sp.]
MASVLLPTREWTDACDELAAQLRADDELLVICDAPDDPVTDHPAAGGSATTDPAAGDPATTDPAADCDPSSNVRVVVAGEPTGCSGKANALAVGLEAAARDRIVCTDGDFVHGPEWLRTVSSLLDRHAAVSTVPVFESDVPPWPLIEPVMAIGSLALLQRDGVWGGLMAFDRRDVDLDRLRADLRRTVSDDGLLWERLDDVTTVRSLRRRVPVDGRLRPALDRWARFVRTFYFFAPRGLGALLGVWAACAALSVASLPVAALGTAAAAAGVYRAVGTDRWTWLLAYPAVVLLPLLLAVGLARREFEWTGRRYRWAAKFDVRVVSERSE